MEIFSKSYLFFKIAASYFLVTEILHYVGKQKSVTLLAFVGDINRLSCELQGIPKRAPNRMRTNDLLQ